MTVSETLHQVDTSPRRLPTPGAVIEILHPITWFPPMWAYLCGVVASGADPMSRWPLVLLGIVLAGPIVCGMSQAINDWCDRDVDAINEPHRPIPSGRMPATFALLLAVAMSATALWVGWQLGPWGFGATVLGVLAAWAYSAPPLRLKRSGWWGPGVVGLAYETLPWVTGAAVLSAGAPRFEVVAVALFYGLGAHGIMTLNDFKAIEGDRATGIRSLPAALGPEVAAKIAATGMVVPQAVVVCLVAIWGQPIFAAVIASLVLAQVAAMRVLLRDPEGKAPWFNGTGVALYVSGMMVAAVALRGIG